MTNTPQSSAAAATAHADVVVIGGGVAGLWSAAVLAQRGLGVMLIERGSLGGGQTVASQGILHGGIKYTLGGAATAAAKAVADMPARWQAAMTGAATANLDLSAVRSLSPAQYLWTTGSLFSRVTAKVAATAIRTAVRRVEPAQACEGLREATGIDVHRVDEPIIEPRSLVAALRDRIVEAGGVVCGGEPRVKTEPNLRTVRVNETTVSFSTVVLAAGNGSQQLLAQLVPTQGTPVMQRRPLHMVMVRSTAQVRLPELYGHCIAALSDKPRLTITTQVDAQGRTVWYVGGNIAETGVDRSPAEQIAATQEEIAQCLPWISTAHAEWATLRIDRAEGCTPSGQRPDQPVVAPVQGAEAFALAVWPTKLVFAPLVGDRVAEWVTKHRAPSTAQPGAAGLEALRGCLPIPSVAALPWDREETLWT